MADLRQMGAPAEVIEDYRRQQRQADFPVLPENWDALSVFQRSQSQWRYAHNGQITGLDYSGVDVVIRRMGLEEPDRVFEQVQIMEGAYINEVNHER